MTLGKVLKAYKYIGELTNLVFPYSVTKNLLLLKNRLNAEIQTIVTMEKSLATKLGGKILENGSYKFTNEESQKTFIKEWNSIMNESRDLDIPVVDLSKYADSVRLSVEAMEALKEVIIFEKEDEVNGR